MNKNNNITIIKDPGVSKAMKDYMAGKITKEEYIKRILSKTI